jgi:MtN3 and saliva related transmembrane protein
MNTYCEISRVVTMLASMTMTFGLYAQCWKVFRTRSAKDFTLTLVASLIFTEAVWLNYGMVLREWPIILSSVLNIGPVTAIMYGYLRYRTAGAAEVMS